MLKLLIKIVIKTDKSNFMQFQFVFPPKEGAQKKKFKIDIYLKTQINVLNSKQNVFEVNMNITN